MIATRVVTLAGDPEHEAVVSAQLNLRSDIELVLRCVDRGELLGSIRGAALDAIVSVGAPPWLDGQCAEEAAERGLIVVGITDDDFENDRLRSLGAIVLPLDSSVDEIMTACLSVPPPTPADAEPSAACGKLAAVWGPKGAPGRTRVAIELAFEIAASESSTLLIDGDAYGGDVLQLLGILDELPTVIWAARMAAKDQLTPEVLEHELIRTIPTGPAVLPGIPRADLWAEISDFGWRTLLATARSFFRFTVCDVGFCLEPEASPYGEGDGRNRMARTTVSSSDHVVAVCRGDALGMKNFIWSFQQLTDLVDRDNVVVVVNRHHASEEEQIAKLLGRYIGKRPVAYIPDRPAQHDMATRNGVPVSKLPGGSDSGPAIRSLAASIGANVAAHGLLSRIAGKR